MHYTGASKKGAIMKYVAEYSAYVNGSAVRTFYKEFLVVEEFGIEHADDFARTHAGRYVPQHVISCPGETCTVQNIHRHEEGKPPACIYSEH